MSLKQSLATDRTGRATAVAFALVALLAGLARSQDGAPARLASPFPRMEDVDHAARVAVAPDDEPSVRATPDEPARAPLAKSAKSKRSGGSRDFAPIDRRRVHHDAPGDGRLWARGATYKASFDVAGVTYVPFLGARAPVSTPVTFRLDSMTAGGEPVAFDAAAAPSRSGDRIDYDRGALLERYETRSDSIEQVFVLESLPAAGDLVLRIAVSTDLDGREAAEALEFAGDLGTVSYGRAVAIDADGASAPAATAWAEGAIEIRVSGTFLSTARLPLVIDPVISTLTLDDTELDDFSADVAYDLTNDRYLIVYEEVFSASDHDVYAVLLDSSGASVLGDYVDQSSANWVNPRTAAHNASNVFLVAAEVGAPGSRSIQGRIANAASLALGPAITINGTEGGDKLNPDVGGDPFPSNPSYFLVVWERISSTGRDIHARLVDGSGVAQGTSAIPIDTTATTIDTNPSVSKSDGTTGWNLAWQREMTATDHDLHGARMRWDGAILTASTPIDTTSADTTRPCASSPLDGSLNWLVVFERDLGADHDVEARLLTSALVTLHSQSLTGLESAYGSGTLSEDQVNPSVDCDGATFAVAYAESYLGSASDYDVYASTFAPSPAASGILRIGESHANLAFDTTREDRPQLTATKSGGGPARRHFAVWDDDVVGESLHDIEGALYDVSPYTYFCFPGSDALACPCANPGGSGKGCDNSSSTGGAQLTLAGEASIAADSLVLTSAGEKPTATSIFLQGTALATVVFGQGVRCTGGNLKRLYLKVASGGVAVAPEGLDPSVHARSAALGDPLASGSVRYYNTYYRDPTVLGGCPTASTFNTTQGARAIWLP